MPSYDKQKLLALLERRRRAHSALTDLSARWRDAKADKVFIENHIRNAALGHRAPAGFVERLLSLPLLEVATMTAADIQGYDRKIGNVTHRYQTGVNFQTYQNYIKAREKEKRLAEQLAGAKHEFEHFAITPRLRDAVRAWGFTDPELEL